MGLNVASLILEYFMLSTDNNLKTEKLKKELKSYVSACTVTPQLLLNMSVCIHNFFPCYILSWHYFDIRDHDKPNLTVDRKRKLFPWTKVNGAPKICYAVFQKDSNLCH